MNFWKCFGYLLFLGVFSHFAGEALPRRWFREDSALWQCRTWERGGRVYEQLHIRKWKDRLPDMSRIMPDMLPKRIGTGSTSVQIDALIRETCVAELTHGVLIVAAFVCVLIWPGRGGAVMTALFALGNVPYILIQRYNRPHLIALRNWMMAKEATGKRRAPETDDSGRGQAEKKGELVHENVDSHM